MTTVKIKDNKLVIEIELNSDREPSTSGKTLSVASTRGNVKTGIKDPTTGREIILGLNAYVYAKEK